MPLSSDAVMALFYDIDGDPSEHDDWHTYEHMHERLSIPGFIRASRWLAESGSPRYLVIYEVADTRIATSPAYLERLNNPSEWTRAMMTRFRGMVRGFCTVQGSAGFGMGRHAVAIRFMPEEDRATELKEWLSREILPVAASRRGMAGVHLLCPDRPPPMTDEQAIRGPDQPMSWLLLVTGYDADSVRRAVDVHLSPASLAAQGAAPDMEVGSYLLHYTATALEVSRSCPHPVLSPRMRLSDGERR